MKILIGFISIAWLVIIIITVVVSILGHNFNNGEGIFGALGSLIGGILFSIPSYFGIKYSFENK